MQENFTIFKEKEIMFTGQKSSAFSTRCFKYVFLVNFVIINIHLHCYLFFQISFINVFH